MAPEPTEIPVNRLNGVGNVVQPVSPSTPLKAVTIFDEPEHIEAPVHYTDDSYTPGSAPQSPKIHRASISGKKMTGRPVPPSALQHLSSSASLNRTVSYLKLDDDNSGEQSTIEGSSDKPEARQLLSQVCEWLSEERSKRSAGRHQPKWSEGYPERALGSPLLRTESEQDLALDKLESILIAFNGGLSLPTPPRPTARKSSSMNLRRASLLSKKFKSKPGNASSDTEWIDGDINVPHVEAGLDNSKTMAFTGGEGVDVDEVARTKDEKNWEVFKQEIVRMTHTLKIRGWRRIPIEKASIILVERLSGALTNAVYVVKPPKDLPEIEPNADGTKPYITKSRPLELLLRVYGPQVEHLIDRDTELDILRRLARKKIGPRLLGYFTNGRLEEYLHAKTLTFEDIHIPETSKQIAKRMRELHDGIELLPSEVEAGPVTFLNWDKWVDRCEKVITWLDTQVKNEAKGIEPPSKRYTRRGFICGVEWPVFRQAFERYRKQLVKEYGGKAKLRERLVFSHNDTQYGNLMRLEPPGDSPLLQPANQHRQLIVIDFEYAGANTPGFEFANHFAEWCCNYHHPEKTWGFHHGYYPTPAEQHRFVRAYIMHRPQFAPGASGTPLLEGREKTNISDFMLDARTPSGQSSTNYDAEEKAREDKVERDIQYLLRETWLWRIVNSAQWVAWGIVQAQVPELDEQPKKSKVGALLHRIHEHVHVHPHSDPLDPDVIAAQEASHADRPETRVEEESHAEGDEEEAEAFDYLGYAQDRAMFFWGDCLQRGIVKEHELPESLLKRIKIVKH